MFEDDEGESAKPARKRLSQISIRLLMLVVVLVACVGSSWVYQELAKKTYRRIRAERDFADLYWLRTDSSLEYISYGDAYPKVDHDGSGTKMLAVEHRNDKYRLVAYQSQRWFRMAPEEFKSMGLTVLNDAYPDGYGDNSEVSSDGFATPFSDKRPTRQEIKAFREAIEYDSW
jgi:hypothetical protein